MTSSHQIHIHVTLLSLLLFASSARLSNDKFPPTSTTGADVGVAPDGKESEELLPFFDPGNNLEANLTVQVGSDVALSCPVQDIGGYKVSWVRRDARGNMQLISYGDDTYVTDGRQEVRFIKPNDWQLRLHSAQRQDGGIYQCQISTHPPKSLQYTLSVIAPTVEIVDDGGKSLKDKIFKAGSTLELRCIVSEISSELDSSQRVRWYHGRRLLNNDTYRGGISVKSWEQKESGYSKLSKLYVANVNNHDSGLYTCSMGKVRNATVWVSVYVQGEAPSAMQHGIIGGTTSGVRCMVAMTMELILPLVIRGLFIRCCLY